jgi:prefoldin subunit 5
MKKAWIVIAALAGILAVSSSCSTTGFMGLAKEESVAEMNEKHTSDIEELKTHIERIDALSEELEAALAEVERAKADAAKAVEMAKTNAEASVVVEKKTEEVRELLQKLEAKIAKLPKEAINEMVKVLQTYADAQEE